MPDLKDRRAPFYRGPEPWFVYALLDPRDEAIRYIGSSFSPHARVLAHWNAPTGNMRGWIDELYANALRPVVRILAEFKSRADAMDHESALIAAMKRDGVALLNVRGWMRTGPPAEREDLAARLAWARAASGLSAYALSLKAGLSKTHVSMIENRERGKLGNIDPKTAQSIAGVLGIPWLWLLYGEGEGEAPTEAQIKKAVAGAA